jgi:hypothetical protein
VREDIRNITEKKTLTKSGNERGISAHSGLQKYQLGNITGKGMRYFKIQFAFIRVSGRCTPFTYQLILNLIQRVGL